MPDSIETETNRAFRAHLDANSTEGVLVLVCPKCQRVHKELPARINGLNRYAFKNGVCVEIDGRGCCYR